MFTPPVASPSLCIAPGVVHSLGVCAPSSTMRGHGLRSRLEIRATPLRRYATHFHLHTRVVRRGNSSDRHDDIHRFRSPVPSPSR